MLDTTRNSLGQHSLSDVGADMTVYVDDPVGYPNCKLRWKTWSHMWSDEGDSAEELHLVADAIGMRRSWFQGNHYDIVPSKRLAAIKLGVVPVSQREGARIRIETRKRRTLQAALEASSLGVADTSVQSVKE